MCLCHCFWGVEQVCTIWELVLLCHVASFPSSFGVRFSRVGLWAYILTVSCFGLGAVGLESVALLAMSVLLQQL